MDEFERARSQWAHRGQTRPAWAITPRPDQESVWDYPRPPALVTDRRLVRVVHRGTIVARSRRTVRVLETASPPTFYIPPADVRRDLLIPAPGSSHCEWKGRASYWSVRLDGHETPNVAWSYEDPSPAFRAIRHYIGFYPGKVECYVDAARVESQAGGFYGGWITPDIVGPFKGEPGTGRW